MKDPVVTFTSLILPGIIADYTHGDMRRARSNLAEKDYDVCSIWNAALSLNDRLEKPVIRFTDIKQYPDWWLVVRTNKAE